MLLDRKLEKEMATHSSILAWRIPWREEPGGLLSMGSHRVRRNWRDLAAAAADRKQLSSWQMGLEPRHNSLPDIPGSSHGTPGYLHQLDCGPRHPACPHHTAGSWVSLGPPPMLLAFSSITDLWWSCTSYKSCSPRGMCLIWLISISFFFRIILVVKF